MQLNTKIGAVAIAVSCVAKASAAVKIEEMALKYALYHVLPAVIYNKDSGLKRGGEYSEAVRAATEAAFVKTLESCFDNIEASFGEHVAPVSAAVLAVNAERKSLWNSMKGIATEDVRKQLFPEFYSEEAADSNEAVE